MIKSQALILAPTRELAQQIQKVAPDFCAWLFPIGDTIYLVYLQVVLALGDYMQTQCHACIGGTNVR
jgi:translation initiation factor 4A